MQTTIVSHKINNSTERVKKFRANKANEDKLKTFNQKQSEYIREIRKVKEPRTKEQESDPKRRRATRENEEVRIKEQEFNTNRRRATRENEEIRIKEQELNTNKRRDTRENEEIRIKEQAVNSHLRAIAREDPVKRRRDNDCLIKYRNSIKNIIKNLDKSMISSPTFICICDGGLFFQRSVKKLNENLRTTNRDVNDFIFKKTFPS